MLTKKQQAQKDNHAILRLRGILPQLPSLIPNRIKQHLSKHDIRKLEEISKRIMLIMDREKKRVFVCSSCARENETKMTKNKKALYCDQCGCYRENLFLAKPTTYQEKLKLNYRKPRHIG